MVVAGKWRIEEDLLPRSMTVTHKPNGTEFYPAYCAGHNHDFLRDLHSPGAFYVTNPQTSKALVEASRTTPFVWIDDVWVH